MNEHVIISRINEYLHYATRELCDFLKKLLPRVTYDWWQDCVLDNLSYSQRIQVDENNISELEQLDLAALLRVTDKSWQEMRSVTYLRSSERRVVKETDGHTVVEPFPKRMRSSMILRLYWNSLRPSLSQTLIHQV